MKVPDLLSRLRDLDIMIWVDGDQIKINAPKGALTPDLKKEITENKRELIHFLQTTQTASHLSVGPVIPLPPDSETEIPLTFAQQRLWFLDQYDPNNLAYTIVKVYELNGPLNLPALEQSLSEILRRHSVLRTRFAINECQQPVQVIEPFRAHKLPVTDLQPLPADTREESAHQHILKLAQKPFALTKEPLFKSSLLKLKSRRHWLVVLIHHIICDGWSTNIFLYELQTLYNAFSRGLPSPLPELPIQYSDYALWQRQDQTIRSLQPGLKFWLETLKKPLPILELPADFPRPALQSFAGANQRGILPPELLQHLHQMSSQYKLTPYMILLAAFQILIYRYTNQDDLIIGTPQANRPQSEIEPLIGLFVNTLAIRTNLAGNPTGMELLQRVKDSSLQAFDHQAVPFEMIVENLNPDRNTSHSPVFQVFFTLQNVPDKAVQKEDLEFSTITVDPKTAKFDLSLEIYVIRDQVYYNFEYNTALFKAETIQRMLGHYLLLLHGLCKTPHLPIGQLPLLTPAESRIILQEWNETGQDFPLEQTLPVLFQAQVQRTPHAVAVSDEERQITYVELDQRANQLAHYLMDLGVGPETLVGVCLPRSIDLVVSLLAILKAGGAYVPLDPSYPSDRLQYMLADSQAPLLLTHSNLIPRLSSLNCKIIALNNETEQLAQQSPEPIPLRSTPENLAYVIYTSGSTGKPKGVQVLLRGLSNFLFSMRAEPGITATDKLLSVTSLSFDIAGLELYLPLICGAQLVIVSNTTAADGFRLRRVLEQTKATGMQATPTTWRQLLSAGWAGAPEFKALCGGEALPKDLMVELVEQCGAFWNMYGPTETTIWSTIQKITAKDELITIGKPIANTQVYILDALGQPVPVGVTGELYIGGEGLARGYLNQPELTSEKFLPNPFSTKPDARYYRTGDLSRYLPDGRIEFLGRKDEQIKLHGVRIELGEISNTLLNHAGVKSAVVVGQKDSANNPYLAAFLVAEPMAQLKEDDLRYYLSERLPTAMIPTRYIFLEQMPLTPNGKINRKALPVPDVELRSADQRSSPRNAIEAKLIQIWNNLLHRKHTGVHDDFFQLGGHSLLAVQMLNQIQEVFGVLLPLTSLFHQPDIEHLANLIYQHLGSMPWPSLVEIQPAGSRPPFFCVHGMPGDVLWYGRLVPYMDPDQPLWGLESLGLDGIKTPLTTIEEMASFYIQEIKKHPAGRALLHLWIFIWRIGCV